MVRMLVGGQWIESAGCAPVISAYSGEVVDTVPAATTEHVEQALSAAVQGASQMAKLSAYDRNKILHRAADLLSARTATK